MALQEKTKIGMLFGVVVAGMLSAVGAFASATDTRSVLPVQPMTGPVRFVALAADIAVQPLERPAPPAEPEVRWESPADGQISSGFGIRWGAMHKGIDIANEIGTPVRAAATGTVIDSGPIGGYGLWIRIAHEDDVVSLYGHIDETYVEVGQPVQAGEVIAAMGDRGQSTGPHLHFQIEISGRPVDPVLFYRRMSAELTD